jgi:hypothetical protein
MNRRERIWEICHVGLFLAVLAVVGWHLLRVAGISFLWTDELLSWWVVGNKSFSELWAAIYRGSDGMFPAFYVVSWCWIQMFGHSDLAVRAPSLLFALLGAGMSFALIRKLWGAAAASVCVGVVIAGNGMLLAQAGQFRGYGMMLGLTSCGLFLLVSMSPSARNPRALLWGNAVTQMLLCLTHPFGVLYSAMLGTGKVVATACLEEKRWHWSLVWSYVPAAIGLLLWLPGMREVTKLNLPHGSVAPLPAGVFARDLVPQLSSPWGMAAIFAGALVLLLATALTRREPPAEESRRDDRRTAIILAVAVLGVGPLGWLISQITEPLLLPRHLVPSAWAWAIVGASIWSRISRQAAPGAQFAAASVVLGLSCFSVLSLHFPKLADRNSEDQPLALGLRFDRVLASGLADRHFIKDDFPVFVEGLQAFLPRDYYNPGKLDYRLLLNRKFALEKGMDVLGASLEQNLAVKMVENGLAPGKVIDVVEASAAVKAMPAFYLIDFADRTTAEPLEAFLRDKGWQVEVVCPNLMHPNVGISVIKKFIRPVEAPAPP